MSAVAPLFINLTTGAIQQIASGDVILSSLIPWDVPGAIGSTTPGVATFTNLTAQGDVTLGNAGGDALSIAAANVTWSNNPTHSGDHTFDCGQFAVVASGSIIFNTNEVSWASGSVLHSSADHVFEGTMTFAGGGFVFDSSGNFLVAIGVVGTGGAGVIAVGNSSAPTTGPADTVQFYSSDDAPGHTVPSFYCEGTNVVATGQADSASSVRVKMRINGTVRTFLCI